MTQGAEAAEGDAGVTVVGEAVVDLLWRTGERQVRAVPGGSGANVAVGLHRLGRRVTLVTTWGEDPPGALLRDHLARAGVPVLRAPAAQDRTIVALAYLGRDGSASYEFLAGWDPRELAVPAETAVLHVGSFAIVVEPGAAMALRLCREQRERGRTVAADLNVRPAVQPDREAYLAACRRLAAVVDVLKASEEDLAWLRPGVPPGAAARELLAHGPGLVVVTRGGAGAFAVTAGGGEVSVAAPAVEVADTVGAGDAFQAALLDGLARGGGLPDGPAGLTALLHRCTVAAALACTRVGADPPSRAELTAALAG